MGSATRHTASVDTDFGTSVRGARRRRLMSGSEPMSGASHAGVAREHVSFLGEHDREQSNHSFSHGEVCAACARLTRRTPNEDAAAVFGG
jgi:hypothetical protein